MLTLAHANAAIQQQQNATTITPVQVQQLLHNVHGTTFAQILYVTQVKTAAAHKQMLIHKVTRANVQLFNNLLAATNAYTNAVKRSAAQHNNSADAIANFAAASNYFEHTLCYSLVKHKQQQKYYLFALYNTAISIYVHEQQQLTKQQVAQYLTASAAQQLLNPADTVHNVTQDVTHSVIVRTIALASIVQLTAQKQTIAV